MTTGWTLCPATTTMPWTGRHAHVRPATVRLARILKVVDRYAAMISPRKSRSGRSAIESARSVMTRATAGVDEIGQALVRAVGLCPPGTYVRLDNDELGVVVRRSIKSNQPFVVVVGKPGGELENNPRLHSTAEAYTAHPLGPAFGCGAHAAQPLLSFCSWAAKP